MPDFSVILQNPDIRALVQDGFLERAFHDALFPSLLFRAMATPEPWAAQVGDRQIFTGRGLMEVDLQPYQPGIDAKTGTYSKEQWEVTAQKWGRSIDTNMPSSYNAIANLFLSDAHTLGLQAGRTMNRLVRNVAYNAALSGNTIITAPVTSATIAVARLNGFTRARRPDLALGSPVQFAPVSASNPLAVTVYESGVPTARTVIGFTPSFAGDETGPGTLTLNASVTVIARDAILAGNRSVIVRSGGGPKVDDLISSDLFTLATVRSALARLRDQNVPAMEDGDYYCHMPSDSESQIFSDQEFQRLNQSLPDYVMYREFAVGRVLGTNFMRNSECPKIDTVGNGAPPFGTPLWGYQVADPFAGELTATGLATGLAVQRPIFFGKEAVREYYQDMSQLVTDAGLPGKVVEPQITNNGIEINVDRVWMYIRSPMDRWGEAVSTTWKFIGGFVHRTDAATGDAAAFKRTVIVEHAATV